jgi:COP9 signalosome complex subunit 2
VPHPRTLGIIRECGGKAHLQDHNWTKAYEDFWEAFKNYDEGTQPINQLLSSSL